MIPLRKVHFLNFALGIHYFWVSFGPNLTMEHCFLS